MGKQIGISLVLIGLLFFFGWLWGEPRTAAAETPPAPVRQDAPPEEEPLPAGEADSATKLRVLVQGTVCEMDMATYLAGVVRAEMPASFQMEALKAQAVAARTYTLYRMERSLNENHPEADACDDITCCKAYRSGEEAALLWGEQALQWEEKIRLAVAETDGECVLYEGTPVLAVFHSSSAGATQDAAHVWSSALPYLQSVASPENGETVPDYHSSATFSPQTLRALLQQHLPEAELTGDVTTWFTNIQMEKTGLVRQITVGGQTVTGNRLRTVLGLRSPCFTMDFGEDGVCFSVTGYGHGVGMSQYGANVLAGDGMTYREILAWYYTDTTVERYVPG